MTCKKWSLDVRRLPRKEFNLSMGTNKIQPNQPESNKNNPCRTRVTLFAIKAVWKIQSVFCQSVSISKSLVSVNKLPHASCRVHRLWHRNDPPSVAGKDDLGKLLVLRCQQLSDIFKMQREIWWWSRWCICYFMTKNIAYGGIVTEKENETWFNLKPH